MRKHPDFKKNNPIILLFSTAYLPPLIYLNTIINSSKTIIIDVNEHFVKQTIRNRCHIFSPNGIQSLIIPLIHNNRNRTKVKDIRIANSQPWQRQHWRSMCSAYQRSAFFEFYEDDLVGFYEQEYEFLLDFNMDLLKFLLSVFNQNLEIHFTDTYVSPMESITDDFRNLCESGDPQQPNELFVYPQVFEYKMGFQYGLSAIDLLFNMGPASKSYLLKKE